MTELVQARYQPKVGRAEQFSVDADPLDVCNAVAKRLGCRMLEADPVGDAILAERARWDENGIAKEEEKPALGTGIISGSFEAKKPVDLFSAPVSATVGVRGTSVEAHRKLKASGKLTAQQEAVMAWLRSRIGDATRQEISRGSGIAINAVCGRVKELMDAGEIVETGRRRCRVTGETANPVTVVP